MGQTKDKVNKAFDEAQGGVLFIDEAKTLGSGHMVYAQEAVDQIVAKMTKPGHLKKTLVIIAGYTDALHNMLSQSNVGLRSRFTGSISFPDWDANDCVQFIKQKCVLEQIILYVDAEELLSSRLEALSQRPGWANARDCITTLKLLYEARAVRCKDVQELNGRFYTFEDVEMAMSSWNRLRPLLVPVALRMIPPSALHLPQFPLLLLYFVHYLRPV